MAYDTDRNRTVMFGGFGAYHGRETWEYFNADPDCCETLGVTLDMPAHAFAPGENCSCTVTVCNNTGMALNGCPLLVVLDIAGQLFWAPDFTEDFDGYFDEYPSFPENETEVLVIPSFTWPEEAGSFQGAYFHAALTDPGVSFLYGDMDSWEFGWDE